MLTEAVGAVWTTWATGIVTLVIVVLWWTTPLTLRRRQRNTARPVKRPQS